MATMDIASFVGTLFFTFAAAGGSDIRSCEMGVLTTCMFEKGIYDLPYVDVSVRRLRFDRLPTKVDLRNLPQVDEVKIDHDESEGNRGACTYIINNEQAVTVLVESEQPVVCAAHQPSSRPTTTGETTVSVSDHDRPHTISEEDRRTSSQQSIRDRTTRSTLTSSNNLPTSSFSSSKTTERTGTNFPSSETTNNWTQDLPGNVNNTTIQITTAVGRAHKQNPVEKHLNSLWVIVPRAVSVLILISVITLVCCIIKKKYCCKCHRKCLHYDLSPVDEDVIEFDEFD